MNFWSRYNWIKDEQLQTHHSSLLFKFIFATLMKLTTGSYAIWP